MYLYYIFLYLYLQDVLYLYFTLLPPAGLFLSDPIFLCAIIPIKIYSNAEADKATILKENTNKSGIYMWKNKINAKRYVGSSQNLRKRFVQYFNINYLLRNTCMYICNALFKHGYSNFKCLRPEIRSAKRVL